jgi:23S rRNA (uracil1939-C5)-methyltransferase
MPEALAGYAAAVFNPPRAGASRQAEALAASTIATVVAVSCNPATFARDAARLISGGFRLLRVVPVDQFVWTPHLELAAVFRRMIRAADGNDRGLRARIETTTLVSERG